MDLRKYIQNRRTELKAERERLASQNQTGLTTGALIKFDQRSEVILLMLRELELALDWTDAGEPAFLPPLTPDEQRFWKQARDRGLAVPSEIAGQLEAA